MAPNDLRLPHVLPLLSRGKHRNPRKGACFMEMASYLAGERWSDHPACTHPLLAALARLVNDHTTDRGRQRLAPLIPSVIGVTGEDPRIDVRIALRAARTALPVVAEERQRVMAAGVLVANRLLADLDGRAPDSLDEHSRRALDHVPLAAEWATRLLAESPPSITAFRRRGAPSAVSLAVSGIAQACVPDPDGLLRDLLVEAIDDCADHPEPTTTADADGRLDTLAGTGGPAWDGNPRSMSPTR